MSSIWQVGVTGSTPETLSCGQFAAKMVKPFNDYIARLLMILSDPVTH